MQGSAVMSPSPSYVFLEMDFYYGAEAGPKFMIFPRAQVACVLHVTF